MSAHTPGPWIAERFNHLGWTVRTFEEGMACDFICQHVTSPGDAEEANARLIAAAPDLLAALERVDSVATEEDIAELSPDMYEAVMAARAAVAKARGQ